VRGLWTGSCYQATQVSCYQATDPRAIRQQNRPQSQ